MAEYYKTDEHGVFVGSIDLSEFDAIPKGTYVAPPVVDAGQFAQWNGVAWVVLESYPQPPAPEVPASVTRRQFKLGLLSLDLLDDVEAAVAASSDRALQINWAEALDFERNNPFVAQMAAALGKTDAEIDALFILAKTL